MVRFAAWIRTLKSRVSKASTHPREIWKPMPYTKTTKCNFLEDHLWTKLKTVYLWKKKKILILAYGHQQAWKTHKWWFRKCSADTSHSFCLLLLQIVKKSRFQLSLKMPKIWSQFLWLETWQISGRSTLNIMRKTLWWSQIFITRSKIFKETMWLFQNLILKREALILLEICI